MLGINEVACRHFRSRWNAKEQVSSSDQSACYQRRGAGGQPLCEVFAQFHQIQFAGRDDAASPAAPSVPGMCAP